MSLLPDNLPDPLDPSDLAPIMRVTPASIRRWRVTDPATLPPFFTIGTGPKAKMRFPREGVERWLRAKLQGTQENGGSGFPEAA